MTTHLEEPQINDGDARQAIHTFKTSDKDFHKQQELLQAKELLK
jgi:hypothetical protein